MRAVLEVLGRTREVEERGVWINATERNIRYWRDELCVRTLYITIKVLAPYLGEIREGGVQEHPHDYLVPPFTTRLTTPPHNPLGTYLLIKLLLPASHDPVRSNLISYDPPGTPP